MNEKAKFVIKYTLKQRRIWYYIGGLIGIIILWIYSDKIPPNWEFFFAGGALVDCYYWVSQKLKNRKKK